MKVVITDTLCLNGYVFLLRIEPDPDGCAVTCDDIACTVRAKTLMEGVERIRERIALDWA